MSRDTLDSKSSAVEKSEATLEAEEENPEEQPEEPFDPRTLLTPQQVLQFKEIFTILDVQGTGFIPSKLIGIIIRNLGYNPTKLQVREYQKEVDPEGKGLMDFQSFLLPIAQNLTMVPETLEDILSAFRALDEAKVDYIESNVMYEYLTTLGEILEDFEIDLFMKMADPKGEGKIYYQEFLEATMGTPKKQAPKKKDKKKK